MNIKNNWIYLYNNYLMNFYYVLGIVGYKIIIRNLRSKEYIYFFLEVVDY